MTKTFRVQMNIIKKPYDRPVHFKVDGARFETADKTVKFNVNAKYNLDFTFRPPQMLESVLTSCYQKSRTSTHIMQVVSTVYIERSLSRVVHESIHLLTRPDPLDY